MLYRARSNADHQVRPIHGLDQGHVHAFRRTDGHGRRAEEELGGILVRIASSLPCMSPDLPAAFWVSKTLGTYRSIHLPHVQAQPQYACPHLKLHHKSTCRRSRRRAGALTPPQPDWLPSCSARRLRCHSFTLLLHPSETTVSNDIYFYCSTQTWHRALIRVDRRSRRPGAVYKVCKYKTRRDMWRLRVGLGRRLGSGDCSCAAV